MTHSSIQRVAFVAGGSAGIGLACAFRLAATGHSIVIGGRSQAKLDDASMLLKDAGAEVTTVALDTADDEASDATVSRILETLGRMDVLVHSVGSAPAGLFNEVDTSEWADAFNSKVLGAVRLMRAVTPSMQRQRYGRIVAIAGTAGKEPDPWMVVAGSVNSALVTVTKSAARQLARDGVTVNAVCPGPTRTARWDGLVNAYARSHSVDQSDAKRALEDQIPAGRPAEAEEVASLVAYLASAEAQHVTGAAIAIDGGQSRSS